MYIDSDFTHTCVFIEMLTGVRVEDVIKAVVEVSVVKVGADT